MIKLKVCVVIVTYNRLELLKRTLQALFSQSYPIEQIIIIDNASTDGTDEYLTLLKYLNVNNIFYKKLAENLGGAGGFQVGVELAHKTCCDWVWLMDDDGYPSDQCLSQLLFYCNDFDFYGPLVLDDQTQEILSFPINYKKYNIHFQTNTQLKKFTQEENENILENVLIPFNGVLLKRNLIDKIGVPQAKFFIWGDDMEYTYRAQLANARIGTISDIYFYHPTAPNLGTKMFFGRMQFNDTDSQIKLYCLCRNNTNNLKNYRSAIHALAFIAKTYWFYLFTKPSWSKLKFVHAALWAGWRGNFNQHRSFIGRVF